MGTVAARIGGGQGGLITGYRDLRGGGGIRRRLCQLLSHFVVCCGAHCPGPTPPICNHPPFYDSSPLCCSNLRTSSHHKPTTLHTVPNAVPRTPLPPPQPPPPAPAIGYVRPCPLLMTNAVIMTHERGGHLTTYTPMTSGMGTIPYVSNAHGYAAAAGGGWFGFLVLRCGCNAGRLPARLLHP